MNTLAVCVRGAGVEGVNGMYSCDGMYNQRPLFKHIDEVMGETYYLYRTKTGWMIVTSTSFPSLSDVPFYQCDLKRDMDSLLPPSTKQWRCCTRDSFGIRELLKPPPFEFELSWMMEPHTAAMRLAAVMTSTEMGADKRKSGKATSPRNAASRQTPICVRYVSQASGCELCSAECEFLHLARARETALALMLLKAIE
jgi:hypothetical protein